jgi:hypothetical protein
MAATIVDKSLRGWIGRAIRSTLSLGISLAITRYSQSPWGLVWGPVIQTAGKALRDKYPKQMKWLPL